MWLITDWLGHRRPAESLSLSRLYTNLTAILHFFILSQSPCCITCLTAYKWFPALLLHCLFFVTGKYLFKKSRIMVLTWIQHISAGKRGVPCVLNILCEVQHCNFIRAVPNAIWNSNASTKVLHHKMSLASGLTSSLCVALSLLSSFFSGSRKVLQNLHGLPCLQFEVSCQQTSLP